jgi:hypothetical protein
MARRTPEVASFRPSEAFCSGSRSLLLAVLVPFEPFGGCLLHHQRGRRFAQRGPPGPNALRPNSGLSVIFLSRRSRVLARSPSSSAIAPPKPFQRR